MRRAVLVGVVMAVAVLSASGFAWAATVSFAPAVNYEVGSGPVDVASADFDGDGKLDLATANIFSDDVSVLLGKGDGTFEPQQRFAAGEDPQPSPAQTSTVTAS